MIVYAQTNAAGRIVLAMTGGTCPAGCAEYEAPEGFTLEAMADYIPKGSALVYDPLPATEEPTTETLLLEMAADHEYRLCLMELGVNDLDL